MSEWYEPYLMRAYDPQTYDCAALVEDVLLNVFGRHVVVPSHRPDSLLARSRALWEHVQMQAVLTDQPVAGDVVLMLDDAGLYHVGVYVGGAHGGSVLHCSREYGRVVCQRLTQVGLEVAGVYRCV